MQSYRLFKRLRPFVKMRWRVLSLVYACTIIDLTLGMLQPFLFAYLIDTIFVNHNKEMIVPILIASAVAAIGSSLFTVIRQTILRYLHIRGTLDNRELLNRHIRKLPMEEIEKNGAGKFAAILSFDTSTAASFMNMIITEFFAQFYIMIISLGFIFYMNWRIGLIALISIVAVLVIPRLYRKGLIKYASHVREHNEVVGTHLYEHIEASKEIRMFGLESWEEKRNTKLYKSLIKSSTLDTLFQVLSNQSGVLVISLIIVAIYAIASGQVLNGSMSIGMLVASITYLYNVLQPVRVINDTFAEVQRTEIATERIEAFMRIPTEQMVRNQSDANVIIQDPTAIQDASPILSGQNVRVQLDGHEVIKGIDYTVNRGQVIAFVGRSGSGKTTLFKTLMGFAAVHSGELLIEGRPLSQYSRDELSSKIGVVFQETYIIRGTLLENIALGNLEASYEEVYEAACQANLQQFIDHLPEGLLTRVDHNGFQLSGGQKQRIAIARILLRKPSILLLDEPTSALDWQTEAEVLTTLHQVMIGRTTLISTHRVSIISDSDHIYVLEQGLVVESGTHDNLMQANGYYYAAIERENEGKAFTGHRANKLEADPMIVSNVTSGSEGRSS